MGIEGELGAAPKGETSMGIEGELGAAPEGETSMGIEGELGATPEGELGATPEGELGIRARSASGGVMGLNPPLAWRGLWGGVLPGDVGAGTVCTNWWGKSSRRRLVGSVPLLATMACTSGCLGLASSGTHEMSVANRLLKVASLMLLKMWPISKGLRVDVSAMCTRELEKSSVWNSAEMVAENSGWQQSF